MSNESMQLCNLRGNEFAVRTRGNGVPLLWGHCLLGSMEVDDAVGLLDWDDLADRVRCIRFDARGHGESAGSSNPGDYAWQAQADDIWAIADQYASGKKVILGGASMGSATALHAALKYPNRVAGLVLVLPPTAWASRPQQAKLYRRMAPLIGWASRVGKLLQSVMRLDPEGLPLKRALAVAVTSHVSSAHSPCMRAALLGAAESDLPGREELSKLQIPTVVLTWQGDDAHPVVTAETLQAVLPDVRVFKVSSVEDAANWSLYVKGFLDKLNKDDPVSAPGLDAPAVLAPASA